MSLSSASSASASRRAEATGPRRKVGGLVEPRDCVRHQGVSRACGLREAGEPVHGTVLRSSERGRRGRRGPRQRGSEDTCRVAARRRPREGADRVGRATERWAASRPLREGDHRPVRPSLDEQLTPRERPTRPLHPRPTVRSGHAPSRVGLARGHVEPRPVPATEEGEQAEHGHRHRGRSQPAMAVRTRTVALGWTSSGSAVCSRCGLLRGSPSSRRFADRPHGLGDRSSRTGASNRQTGCPGSALRCPERGRA